MLFAYFFCMIFVLFAASAPAPVIDIIFFTSMYTSLSHKDLTSAWFSWIWFEHYAFSSHIIIQLNLVFYPEFWWLIICVAHLWSFGTPFSCYIIIIIITLGHQWFSAAILVVCIFLWFNLILESTFCNSVSNLISD